MAKRLSRIERNIERLKEKISEYQQQLKELEAAKTEQENLQIIQLVRSMNKMCIRDSIVVPPYKIFIYLSSFEGLNVFEEKNITSLPKRLLCKEY